MVVSHLPFHRSGGLLYSYWCFGVALESSSSEEGLTLFSGLTPCGGAGQGSGRTALGGFGRAGSAVGGQTSRKRKSLCNRKCPSTKCETTLQRAPVDAREGREGETLVASCPSTLAMPLRFSLSVTPSTCWPRGRARHVCSSFFSSPSLAGVVELQESLVWPSWWFSASARLVGGRACADFASHPSVACSRGALCIARAAVSRESTASAWLERQREGLFAWCL